MASVPLDNNVLLTQHSWDQKDDPTVGSSEAFPKPQQDAYESRRSVTRVSQDKAIVIPSDSNSDWGDLDDDDPDTFFPPVEQLRPPARYKGIDSENSAREGMSLNVLCQTDHYTSVY